MYTFGPQCNIFNYDLHGELIGFQKFTNGYEGICMSGTKFLKELQVGDKSIG